MEIKLIKSSYSAQETLQAEISGGLIDPIAVGDIGIYLKSAVHSSPIEGKLIKDNNKYYYSAILPQVAGDYSLRIEDVKHYENNAQVSTTVEKNFTITNTNSSYLSFDSGYILATRDFSVNVKAYNEEQEIVATFAPTHFKETFSLGNGESRTLYFSISGLNGTIKDNIKIGAYTLPVIIIANSTANTTTNKSGDLSYSLDVYPEKLGATILANKDSDPFEFELSSLGRDIPAIEISTSDKELKVSEDSFDEFNGRKNFSLTINSARSFEGSIWINSSNDSVRIPVNVMITTDLSKVNYTSIPSTQLATCSELKGKVCDYAGGEECDRFTYDSSNKACCLSERSFWSRNSRGFANSPYISMCSTFSSLARTLTPAYPPACSCLNSYCQ